MLQRQQLAISIHAPRAGCDFAAQQCCCETNRFQSTHPVRGATGYHRHNMPELQISIHAPRAGCDGFTPSSLFPHSEISIHAPRAGCDSVRPAHHSGLSYFNPRTPCGVRPFLVDLRLAPAVISIHAPRAGCDQTGAVPFCRSDHFNPRTPCGVRLSTISSGDSLQLFQSTHPVRGATIQCDIHSVALFISIHAPRAGCDSISVWVGVTPWGFQSTHPVRGATAIAPRFTPILSAFQSTHPVRGATQLCGALVITTDFNPRTPCGVRLRKRFNAGKIYCISIHAPRAGCDSRSAAATTVSPRHFNPRTPCGVRPW